VPGLSPSFATLCDTARSLARSVASLTGRVLGAPRELEPTATAAFPCPFHLPAFLKGDPRLRGTGHHSVGVARAVEVRPQPPFGSPSPSAPFPAVGDSSSSHSTAPQYRVVIRTIPVRHLAPRRPVRRGRSEGVRNSPNLGRFASAGGGMVRAVPEGGSVEDRWLAALPAASGIAHERTTRLHCH
jgi:hypothetical protein